MASFDAVSAAIVNHFAVCVFDIQPFGKNTNTWKRHIGTADFRLVENVERVRAFEVWTDGTIEDALHGVTEIDYNVTMNIDICYHAEEAQTGIGLRDYHSIRNAIYGRDSSHVAGYQFSMFSGVEWIDKPESKFRYMRIPVQVRVAVTE